jgi:hypothetical protein
MNAASRRRFVLTGAGAVLAGSGLSACSGVMERFATIKEARERVLELLFNTPAMSCSRSSTRVAP